MVEGKSEQGAQRATYRAPEYNVPHLLPHLGFLIGPKNTNLVEDVDKIKHPILIITDDFNK